MDRVLTKWTVVLVTQILSLSSQKNLGLGSGIRKHIPDHGSMGQKDTGSRIRTATQSGSITLISQSNCIAEYVLLQVIHCIQFDIYLETMTGI